MVLVVWKKVSKLQQRYGIEYSTYAKILYARSIEKLLNQIGYDMDKVLLGCHFTSEAVDCKLVAKPVFDHTYGRCLLVDMQRDQGGGGLGQRLTPFTVPNFSG